MGVFSDPRATLVGFLEQALQEGASDLHLRAGQPPHIRVHGEMRPLQEHESLSPDDASALAGAFLNEAQKRDFAERKELDFSVGLTGLSRFRVNIFRQKETVGAVFRAIPFEIKSFEEL